MSSSGSEPRGSEATEHNGLYSQPDHPAAERELLLRSASNPEPKLASKPIEALDGVEQPHQQYPAVPAPAAAGTAAAAAAASRPTTASCRICLEEDDISSMQAPCGCAGTLQYAHHECVQKWINEKGNMMCEICEQPYRGDFAAPPPPPPPAEPRLLPNGAVLVAVNDERHAYNDSFGYDEYGRPTGHNFCFSFLLFIVFMAVFQHTLVFTAPQPGDSPYAPSNSTASGGMPGPSDTYDDAGANFGTWMMTKAFMIAIPLYVIMRLAARQRQHELYADTEQPGLVLLEYTWRRGGAGGAIAVPAAAAADAGSDSGSSTAQSSAATTPTGAESARRNQADNMV